MESPRKTRLRQHGKEERAHPSVFERLSGLLPRHSSAPAAPPPVIQQEAPYERALKVQIVSWNMNDTLPKGDLAALLGVVPPYAADGKSEFQLDDTGHPYHIIVVAGQECPTGLLPMGMGAVKMERSKEHKSKSKPKDDDSPSKPKRPRRSEEDEYQQLEPSTPIQQQHSSGWSALLEDWYCKGLGAKRFSLEDWTAMGIPPSPTPSRSPSLPALGLPPAISDPAKLSVPPSPRRMNTWMPTESVGPYVLVAKERLMGIYLAVFVHKETRSLVRGCSKSSVTAGLIGGRLGNKGGVGISLNIAGTSFLFVNAHLAAHEGRQAMRLENMEKIQAELKLDHFGEPVHPRKEPESKPDLTDSFDYTFIFGDLNFRLNVSRLHADWLISRHNYHQAQEFDELRANMRSGTIFPGFEEPPISFPPTFKYDVPKSRHHSRREKDHPRRVGVRVSIRRSRKRRKSKGKIKDVEDPKLEPVNEGETEPILQQTEASSEEDESDQDQESVSAFSAARPSGSTHRPPSTRSHRSGVLSSREPESDSCEDGEGEGSLQHNTQLNAAAPPRAVLKLISRSAKQSWRSIVAKSTSSLGAIPIRSPPGSPTRATLEGRIGRTSPKFGRTSPSGKSGRTSPSNRFVASPTSGRFEAIPTPKFRSTSPISKSGRASPSRKSGRASPTSKSGRASPAPKFGRTSPTHKYAGTHLGLGPSPNMGRSQPNLVIDTGIDGDVPTRVRASVDGGSRSVPNVDAGGKVSGLFPGELKSGLVRTSGEFTKSNGDPVKPNGELKANGEVKGLGVTGVGGTLAPPALIRHNSSVGSAAEAGTAPEDSSSDSEVKGVYDTSSKQRVPSWCDRIVYKSTVLPPQPPPSLPVPNLPGPLSDSFHDDGPFGRVGHIFSKIQRRGSRGRKDSLTPSTRAGSIPTRSKEPSTSSGYGRTREALLSESRPSPFLKHPDGEDDSAIVITHGPSSRPGSSGRGGKRSGRPGSSGSTGKRPGSSGSGAEPASLHWPRTNPFARLLHPHLHTPGGPGLIHAVSMEPVPQPSVNTSPRPRSFSTSEGREKTRESMEVPVQPSEDGGFWRFFRQLTRDTPIVAEPEPEPEPVEVPEERKRGDIVCLSYGTLDDKEMQRLGGKSDHRPVIGTYSVYI